MADHDLLDLEEWDLVLSKMLRFHYNVSEEIKAVVQVGLPERKSTICPLHYFSSVFQAIRTEMKPELIPMAEDKANFGKLVKKAIRLVLTVDCIDFR